MSDTVHDALVIGAGQAGLSASYHLTRMGIEHLLLDANSRPGGAWQHRWDALTMADVHRVADLPGSRLPPAADTARANRAVPAYFAAYERDHRLPVVRPVSVRRVEPDAVGFLVSGVGEAGPAQWRSRTLVNATGTWTRPFVPSYPGQRTFAGTQLHTVDFPGPAWFAGHRIVVVGGGASAVQFLGMLVSVVGAENLVWATRTEPDWRAGSFTPEIGRAVIAQVQEQVMAGLTPRSVVSVTGLRLREQESEAERLGVYARRRPMFSRIEPGGVRWDDPEPAGAVFEPADVILWATGFRAAVDHLAPLHLRSPHGGIQLAADGTSAVADPRVQLVGYGPSASTIGANRAGRSAARGVRTALQAKHPGPAADG
ncbi:NAD(P)/FAD-dependent oxidoreductase [Micropruina sonneratiae]|uniref:NAD(P)/FAD-dependent oxidoreductase n=1 Tax=Micropruina sonneratiae TaxID=2986940 RepID=UPI002227FEED|nr:NAD(P)/FAD-dependent oxidoreductase [Micropruina sp. KQZ13P-5]MCW3158406.1 NAD(P)/FAD-dependent oxidoreductase [Micropruina sp. KQZ13P-5]